MIEEEFEGHGAPTQSLKTVRKFIPKRFQPWLRGLRKRWQQRHLELAEPYKSVFSYTQVSQSRQECLVGLCGIIERDNIQGAIVECGVLDGGTAALMAASTHVSKRAVHLFDAWQGLPPVTKEDGVDSEKWVGQVVGSPRRVKQIFHILGVHPDRVFSHAGWFHDTFPKANIDKIALLHIDCDFYEPTVLCLDRWYPRIVGGGFIQFDDYSSFQGCRQAVDEFLRRNPALKLQIFGRLGQGEAYFLQKM